MKLLGDRLFVALAKKVGFPSKGALHRCREVQLEAVRRGRPLTLFTVSRCRGLIDDESAEQFVRWGEQVVRVYTDYASDLLEPDGGPFEETVPDEDLPEDSCRDVPSPLRESARWGDLTEEEEEEDDDLELLDDAPDRGPPQLVEAEHWVEVQVVDEEWEDEPQAAAGDDLEVIEDTCELAPLPLETAHGGSRDPFEDSDIAMPLGTRLALPAAVHVPAPAADRVHFDITSSTGSTVEGPPMSLGLVGLRPTGTGSQWDLLLGDLARDGMVSKETARRYSSRSPQGGHGDSWNQLLSELERDGLISGDAA